MHLSFTACGLFFYLQRHLQIVNDMKKLRDYYYEEYSALLQNKVDQQRQEIRQRTTAMRNKIAQQEEMAVCGLCFFPEFALALLLSLAVCYIFTHTHMHARTYTRMHAHTHTHVYMHACMHTCTHTCMHAHTHTHTPVSLYTSPSPRDFG